LDKCGGRWLRKKCFLACPRIEKNRAVLEDYEVELIEGWTDGPQVVQPSAGH
jgi:hypothetical protein